MAPKKAKAKAQPVAPTAATPVTNSTVKPVESKPVNTQELPQKEQTVFKNVIAKFESKQYKKAKKLADEILRKYPTHGETLAMKGLIINSLYPTHDKTEAYNYIKKGIAFNLKSHICWHVYGIIYKSDHKYTDAVKCYTQALKLQPENQQIQRELTTLQLQCRLYDGYIEQRRKILISNSKLRSNWLSYAIGNHLNHQYQKAIDILDAYDSTRSSVDTESGNDKIQQQYEESEYILYKNQLYYDSKQYDTGLQYLLSNEMRIVDKLYFKQQCAEYYILLQQYQKAEELYKELLDINNDNYLYHTGLLKSIQLYNHNNQYTVQQQQQLLKLYTTLQSLYPYSSACQRLPLTYISAQNNTDTFKQLIDKYLRNKLTKGIPSLYNDLKPLYDDQHKVSVIQQLIEQYITNLKHHNKYHTDDSEIQSPSVLLWTYIYATSHYDRLANYPKALQYIDAAIQHTPTLVDSYVQKARIYKHSNNHATAYEYMNYARQLDTQDRYLNTKCVRYAFRAHHIEAAESHIMLFIRDTDGLPALNDLQVMWYQYINAVTYYDMHTYNKALKYAYRIDKYFQDFLDDQNDFHQYCLRKMTLRAYCSMIQWADNLKQHRYFKQTSKLIIRIYIELYDKQQAGTFNSTNGTTTDTQATTNGIEHADENEEEEEEVKPSNSDKPTLPAQHNNQQQNTKNKVVDRDPEGWELYNNKQPLNEVQKYVDALKTYSSDDIEVYILGIELYIRLNKPLLSLQAIHAAQAINKDYAPLHTSIVKFIHSIQNTTHSNDTIQSTITTQIQQLTNNQSLTQYNTTYLQQHKTDSIVYRFAVAEATLILDSTQTTQAIELFTPYNTDITHTWQDALAVYQFIQKYDKNAAETYKHAAHKQYPLVPEFGATQPELNDLTASRAVYVNQNNNTIN